MSPPIFTDTLTTEKGEKKHETIYRDRLRIPTLWAGTCL